MLWTGDSLPCCRTLGHSISITHAFHSHPVCSPQPVWLSLDPHHICDAGIAPRTHHPAVPGFPPVSQPGLAEQRGADDAYLDMELPQALLEELGIRGEGDRSHLCEHRDTTSAP